MLGWGILGASAWIVSSVSAGMLDSGRARLVAVASRSGASAAEAAKKLSPSSPPRAYGSYDELLDDPDVDAVYVPLPTALQGEWAVKALRAGKHVLVDKPFASERQVVDILRAAREAGRLFMDNTMFREHPRTHEWIEFARAHPLRQVSTHFSAPMPPDIGNIRWDPELEPLGALGDLGWYTTYAIVCALGIDAPYKRVACFARWSHASEASKRSERGVIAGGSAIFEIDNGDDDHDGDDSDAAPASRPLTASMSFEFESSLRQLLEIRAQDATLHVDDFVIPWDCNFLHAENGAPRRGKYLLYKAQAFSERERDNYEQRWSARAANQTSAVFATFADLVDARARTGKSDAAETYAKRARVVACLMDACYRAAAERRVVEVDTSFVRERVYD